MDEQKKRVYEAIYGKYLWQPVHVHDILENGIFVCGRCDEINFSNALCRLYHDKQMSSIEIMELLDKEYGYTLSPRQTQRLISSYSPKFNLGRMRDQKTSFGLAIKKKRVTWVLRETTMVVTRRKAVMVSGNE